VEYCRPWITYPALGGLAICGFFLDKEVYEGDVIEVNLDFYDESLHQGIIKEGDKFDLYIASTHIAKGEFLIVM
jgi:hypothetical protein